MSTDLPGFTLRPQRPPLRPGVRSCSCLAALLAVMFLCLCGVAFLVEHH